MIATRLLVRLCSILAFALASPAVVTAQSVSFQGLGYLPSNHGNESWVTGVSAGGTVAVGWANSTNSGQQAFSWTAGTMTPLGFAGSGNNESTAYATNANGAVIGGISYAYSIANTPTVWTNGTATALPQQVSSGGTICGAEVLGVNGNATGPSSSVVVGQDAFNPGQPPGCPPGRAVAWINGTETLLFGQSWSPPVPSGIAHGTNVDGSIIVGEVGANTSQTCNPCTQAFRWSGGTGTTLGDFGGNYSAAYATNSDGSVVVGTANVNNTVSQAFRWTQATGLVALGPAAVFSQALGVNANGSVVVGQIKNAGPAFRWTAATGFQNLQVLLTANGVGGGLNGWGLVQATGVSADGTSIVGFGNSPTGGQAWIATLPTGATNNTDTHDFNHASTSDILWLNSGTVAVWLLSAGQLSQASTLATVGSNWQIIGQRDFNGDGNADLLWRDNSGNVAVWFMNGLTVVSTASLGNVPSNWAIYGTGDLNNDGEGDLLWRDSTTGTLAAWFMNGSQIAGTANYGTVPSNWTIVGTDAHGDVLWRDGSGDLAIWQIHGSQVTAAAVLGTVPLNWGIAGVGDFNGDGYIDILWRDSNTGTVSIWLLQGTQILSTASLGVIPSVWTIVQTGDYNGDGMSDILWMDNTGNVAVWFMNGTTIASTGGYGNVGTTWSVRAQNAE